MHALRCLKLPMLTVIVAMAIAAVVPTIARGDGSHGAHDHGMEATMHGMSPSEHAAHTGRSMAPNTHGMSAGEHGGHSMPSDEHAAHEGHSADTPPASSPSEHGGHGEAHSVSGHEGESAGGHTDEHASAAGHDTGHGAGAIVDRPVGQVLAGFAVFNALALLAALLLRRRPAAIKRRETLAHIRRTAGAPEPDPTGEAQS